MKKNELNKAFSSTNPFNNLRIRTEYKAIEIIIKNRTPQEYRLDTKDISIPIANPYKIKKKLSTSRVFIPIILATAASVVLIFGLGYVTIPSLIIGSTVGLASETFINTQTTNKNLIKNLRSKSIDPIHPIMIAPCSTIKKIIFVRKKKVKKILSVTLKRITDSSTLTFDMVLKS